MSVACDIWFESCVNSLSDPQNQRVWSIIVSVFGDLVLHPGDRLSGSALTRIIRPMGIKPEAIRVALHRLRKEGWIESERTGRHSQHFLTGYSRAQNDRFMSRIYAHSPETAQDWHILIAAEAAGMQTLDDLLLTENHFSIGRNVAMGAGAVPDNCDDLLIYDVSARSVPDWLKSKVCPPDLNAACHSLLQALAHIESLPVPDQPPSPLQIATLRTGIVHRWRRVVLRHPNLPAEYFPVDWPGPECREQVFQLLQKFPRPSLAALETNRADR